MRTEFHLSTPLRSVPLLTHDHGENSPSIKWKSERLVRNSHLSEVTRPIVFAATALFDNLVATRTSPAARWVYMLALRYAA